VLTEPLPSALRTSAGLPEVGAQVSRTSALHARPTSALVLAQFFAAARAEGASRLLSAVPTERFRATHWASPAAALVRTDALAPAWHTHAPLPPVNTFPRAGQFGQRQRLDALPESYHRVAATPISDLPATRCTSAASRRYLSWNCRGRRFRGCWGGRR
jgi:hypothetical protein